MRRRKLMKNWPSGDVPVAIAPGPLLPTDEFVEVIAVPGVYKLVVVDGRPDEACVAKKPCIREGSTNSSRYQAWPMPPGFVVEYILGRQLGLLVRSNT